MTADHDHRGDYAELRHDHDSYDVHGVASEHHNHRGDYAPADHPHDGYVSHAAAVEMIGRAERKISELAGYLTQAHDHTARLTGLLAALELRVADLEADRLLPAADDDDHQALKPGQCPECLTIGGHSAFCPHHPPDDEHQAAELADEHENPEALAWWLK